MNTYENIVKIILGTVLKNTEKYVSEEKIVYFYASPSAIDELFKNGKLAGMGPHITLEPIKGMKIELIIDRKEKSCRVKPL